MRKPLEALSKLNGFVEGWPHGAALVGGLAIVARVRTRTTADADLVIVAPPPASHLLEYAKRCGYSYDQQDIQEWFDGGLVRLTAPEGDLDLILADEPFLLDVVQRATSVSFGQVALPVATVEDLLLLKLSANRPIDLDDALAIKDALGHSLDFTYLKHQGEKINVNALRFLQSDR